MFKWISSSSIPWYRSQPAPLKAGYALTVLWASAVGTYLVCSANPVAALKPNEIGDFFAGAFAPLAFLWLVVAVLLQKEELSLQRNELKHSVEALEAQAKETQKLAEQSKESVAIAGKALERERRRELEGSLNEQITQVAKLIQAEAALLVLSPHAGSPRHLFGVPTHLQSVMREQGPDTVFLAATQEIMGYLKSADRLGPVNELPPSFKKLAELNAMIEQISLTAQQERLQAVSLRILVAKLDEFAIALRSAVVKLKEKKLL